MVVVYKDYITFDSIKLILPFHDITIKIFWISLNLLVPVVDISAKIC